MKKKSGQELYLEVLEDDQIKNNLVSKLWFPENCYFKIYTQG